MVICTRPGCGVDFERGSAGEGEECIHHPGAPVFHEGSKSWSCCKEVNKPVLEFDEFLTIKGCTTEQGHTAVKREKETFQSKSSSANGDQSSVGAVPANGVSAASITPMSSTKLAAAAESSAKQPEEAVPFVEEQDPTDCQDEGRIASGSVCKRSGCKATYTGGQRRRADEDCRYHKGTAIFHEGSKGYTCCRRRVLEFDEFLTIEPCTKAEGGHLFVGVTQAAKKAVPLDASSRVDEDEAQCRLDHYETPADVRVTVYAKGVEMERSKIEITDQHVLFSLALPALPATPNNPRRFSKTLLPFSTIDAEASTFTVTRFKIDLVLVKKAKGESWPTLERGEKSYGYGLTFGRNKDT